MSDLSTFTPPPNPGDTLRRVLVIKLGALGDFIQARDEMTKAIEWYHTEGYRSFVEQ